MIKYMYYEFNFFVGKYLPPFGEIYVQEIPIQKMFFAVFIYQPIFKIFDAHLTTNYMLNCAKKIFHLYMF